MHLILLLDVPERVVTYGGASPSLRKEYRGIGRGVKVELDGEEGGDLLSGCKVNK